MEVLTLVTGVLMLMLLPLSNDTHQGFLSFEGNHIFYGELTVTVNIVKTVFIGVCVVVYDNYCKRIGFGNILSDI